MLFSTSLRSLARRNMVSSSAKLPSLVRIQSLQRRHESTTFYNADVAGLTDDQVEVCFPYLLMLIL